MQINDRNQVVEYGSSKKMIELDIRLERNVNIVSGLVISTFTAFIATWFLDGEGLAFLSTIFVVIGLITLFIALVAAGYRIYLMFLRIKYKSLLNLDPGYFNNEEDMKPKKNKLRSEVAGKGDRVSHEKQGCDQEQVPAASGLHLSDELSIRIVDAGSGETVGTRRSRDQEQRSATANRDGSVERQVTGRPPQNEQGALEACKALVEFLNRDQVQWETPTDVSGNDIGATAGIDCVSIAADGSDRKLLMQVVRADDDHHYFVEWSQRGEAEKKSSASEAAGVLKRVIGKKARHTAPQDRATTTLVLDGDVAPEFCLWPVPAFWFEHGVWARELGFSSIWLVCDWYNVNRLDQEQPVPVQGQWDR